MYHRRRHGSCKAHALFLLLSLSVAAYLSPAEARSSGDRVDGGHVGGLRGGAVQARFGGAFHGGFGHQALGGVSRPEVFHPFRSSFSGFHRFNHPSFVFFNLGGFGYPPSSYYPPYPYYPPPPAYPIRYDPGYYGVDYQYPYADPFGTYPQSTPNDVLVYTAPPMPPPTQKPQPAAPTPDHLSPPLPLDDGSLHFEVSPAEAKIFIDDRYLGNARELANVAEITASAGQHLLEFRQGTERTFTEVIVSPHRITRVRLALDVPTEASAPLNSEGGRLRLQVAPPGAAIYLDGAFVRAAESAQPLSLRLPPGRHRVQIVMPGYKGYAADVTVPDGGEAVVAVQLARE